MKAGFLTQIMVTPVTGKGLGAACTAARELGFRMFAHNGYVYSVEHLTALLGTKYPEETCAILFAISDLTDYNYNASSI